VSNMLMAEFSRGPLPLFSAVELPEAGSFAPDLPTPAYPFSRKAAPSRIIEHPAPI